MTAAEYRVRFMREPVQDDLQRVNCRRAGQVGHSMCGVCAEHDLPRFLCGCVLILAKGN